MWFQDTIRSKLIKLFGSTLWYSFATGSSSSRHVRQSAMFNWNRVLQLKQNFNVQPYHFTIRNYGHSSKELSASDWLIARFPLKIFGLCISNKQYFGTFEWMDTSLSDKQGNNKGKIKTNSVVQFVNSYLLESYPKMAWEAVKWELWLGKVLRWICLLCCHCWAVVS